MWACVYVRVCAGGKRAISNGLSTQLFERATGIIISDYNALATWVHKVSKVFSRLHVQPGTHNIIIVSIDNNLCCKRFDVSSMLVFLLFSFYVMYKPFLALHFSLDPRGPAAPRSLYLFHHPHIVRLEIECISNCWVIGLGLGGLGCLWMESPPPSLPVFPLLCSPGL